MPHRYLIHIPDEARHRPSVALLKTLESFFPVKFSSLRERTAQSAGEIFTNGADAPERGDGEMLSSFTASLRGAESDVQNLVEDGIRFSDDPGVPFPFRGRSLRTKVPAGSRSLSLLPGEKPLANGERGLVWALSEAGGVKHFRSAFALPDLGAQGSLQDLLNGQRFLEMLPLLHWLRHLCVSTLFDGPALRACFIVDDPNLHWPRYGFVDYQRLAAEAERENYHVSFATIPLDTWFTHPPTAELFRRHRKRLSLLVHGNDHTKRELGRTYSRERRVLLLRQAVQRIEKLERRIGLAVSRVMVPPHGACSEAMLAAMPDCGFEGACISHRSLRAHNATKSWTRNLGLLPAELIQGCPVLPRWAMSDPMPETILLAAYLGQPIILRGHHQDLRNGTERLRRLAGYINGLGPVTWADVGKIGRMNYQWRAEGDELRLKPFSLRMMVAVARGINRISIEDSARCESGVWKIWGLGANTIQANVGQPVLIPEGSNRQICLEATVNGTIPDDDRSRPFGLAAPAFCRRLLTEGRDRLLGCFRNETFRNGLGLC